MDLRGGDDHGISRSRGSGQFLLGAGVSGVYPGGLGGPNTSLGTGLDKLILRALEAVLFLDPTRKGGVGVRWRGDGGWDGEGGLGGFLRAMVRAARWVFNLGANDVYSFNLPFWACYS